MSAVTLALALILLPFAYSLIWSRQFDETQSEVIEEQHRKIMDLLDENIALKRELIQLQIAAIERDDQ